MSDDVLVRVDGVSKKFCRSLKRSLWYGMMDTTADLLGRGDGAAELRSEEFWAVDEVSFELKRGECLGLIGRNGAGKTTLLKMLNGLIKPDKGRIEMRGRVSALISLGAGFNPILTGRENIYVNGAVLGLSKREIEEKIDEIIDFAEIGQFIDAPVQSYSSGMQVRLGFAIATAMRPDVLLLDEVLAVGDAPFRAKCFQQMTKIRKDAAIGLVSHNMEQIAQVCSKVLVMNQGSKLYFGSINEGIRAYSRLPELANRSRSSYEYTHECASVSIKYCETRLAPNSCLHFELSVFLDESVSTADVRVTMWAMDGLAAVDSYTRTQDLVIAIPKGCSVIRHKLGPLNLKAGSYDLSIVLLDRRNNRHLYWGDHVRTVEVEGPVAGAASYAPSIEINCVSDLCKSITSP